jgi:hypothetical protein
MESEQKYKWYNRLAMFFLILGFLPIFIPIVLIPFGTGLINRAESTAIQYLLFSFIFPSVYFARKSVTPNEIRTKLRLDLKAFVAGTICITALVLSILMILAVHICIAYFWISPDLRFRDFPDSPFFHFIEGASAVLAIIFITSSVLFLSWSRPKPQ